jgi:hypothetical protein
MDLRWGRHPRQFEEGWSCVRPHTTDREVRVKAFLLAMIAEGGKGVCAGSLEFEERGGGACEAEPDDARPAGIGKEAKAGQIQREGFETTAGELESVDGQLGFVRPDVPKESEGEMYLGRFGPPDLPGAR